MHPPMERPSLSGGSARRKNVHYPPPRPESNRSPPRSRVVPYPTASGADSISGARPVRGPRAVADRSGPRIGRDHDPPSPCLPRLEGRPTGPASMKRIAFLACSFVRFSQFSAHGSPGRRGGRGPRRGPHVHAARRLRRSSWSPARRWSTGRSSPTSTSRAGSTSPTRPARTTRSRSSSRRSPTASSGWRTPTATAASTAAPSSPTG